MIRGGSSAARTVTLIAPTSGGRSSRRTAPYANSPAKKITRKPMPTFRSAAVETAGDVRRARVEAPECSGFAQIGRASCRERGWGAGGGGALGRKVDADGEVDAIRARWAQR